MWSQPYFGHCLGGKCSFTIVLIKDCFFCWYLGGHICSGNLKKSWKGSRKSWESQICALWRIIQRFYFYPYSSWNFWFLGSRRSQFDKRNWSQDSRHYWWKKVNILPISENINCCADRKCCKCNGYCLLKQQTRRNILLVIRDSFWVKHLF